MKIDDALDAVQDFHNRTEAPVAERPRLLPGCHRAFQNQPVMGAFSCLGGKRSLVRIQSPRLQEVEIRWNCGLLRWWAER